MVSWSSMPLSSVAFFDKVDEFEHDSDIVKGCSFGIERNTSVLRFRVILFICNGLQDGLGIFRIFEATRIRDLVIQEGLGAS